jgi:hypothetical protein
LHERRTGPTIIERDHRLELLVPSLALDFFPIPDRIAYRDSLDADELLKVNNTRLVPIRMLETPREHGSIRIRGEESTRRRRRCRVDVDEDRVLRRFDDGVGVLCESVTVGKEGAGPRLAVLGDEEDHLAWNSSCATRRVWLESYDEELLHSSYPNDSRRGLANAQVDVRVVLVEKVGRRVESRFASTDWGEEGSSLGVRSRRGRVEGDAVDEGLGDVEAVLSLVVGKHASRDGCEEKFRWSREGVCRVECLQCTRQLIAQNEER